VAVPSSEDQRNSQRVGENVLTLAANAQGLYHVTKCGASPLFNQFREVATVTLLGYQTVFSKPMQWAVPLATVVNKVMPVRFSESTWLISSIVRVDEIWRTAS
jgi:hypothetical protein